MSKGRGAKTGRGRGGAARGGAKATGAGRGKKGKEL